MINILLGPSGSGKTAIGRGSGIPELISDTTRDMREGEIDGVTYYFLEKWQFKSRLSLGMYVEHTKYSQNYYGLSKKEIEDKLDKYSNVFVIMDREGIEQMKAQYGDLVRVFFVTAPFFQLCKRLIKRDGFSKALKRVWNMIITREFKNKYIADYVLNNEDGNLQENIDIFKYITSLYEMDDVS